MAKTPHLRDPFVLARPEEGRYYLFGSTDQDIWKGQGTGFDVYVGGSLDRWEGPLPAFRPEPGFWGRENFWAPEVHEHRGFFYMFASFKAPGKARATQILRAERPGGPYLMHSPEPVTPPEWECLDGTLFLDELGSPWLIFCHEWVQVGDGEICARRLSENLTRPAGEPVLLFRASEASWTRPPRRKNGFCDPASRVTDGPFLHRLSSGGLLMLWSSIGDRGYAMGYAYSPGSLFGPWSQEEQSLVSEDGGHGMLFRAFDGRLYLTFHSPNDSPNELFRYQEVVEEERGLRRIGAVRP